MTATAQIYATVVKLCIDLKCKTVPANTGIADKDPVPAGETFVSAGFSQTYYFYLNDG